MQNSLEENSEKNHEQTLKRKAVEFISIRMTTKS
jgi:hypothetical protein